MRKRMTRRSMEASSLMKSVIALEKVVADDAALVKETDSVIKEDKTIVNESVPAGKASLKNNGNQNSKSNRNWPVSESDKLKIAKRLVTLAEQLIS